MKLPHLLLILFGSLCVASAMGFRPPPPPKIHVPVLSDLADQLDDIGTRDADRTTSPRETRTIDANTTTR